MFPISYFPIAHFPIEHFPPGVYVPPEGAGSIGGAWQVGERPHWFQVGERPHWFQVAERAHWWIVEGREQMGASVAGCEVLVKSPGEEIIYLWDLHTQGFLMADETITSASIVGFTPADGQLVIGIPAKTVADRNLPYGSVPAGRGVEATISGGVDRKTYEIELEVRTTRPEGPATRRTVRSLKITSR